VQTGVRLLPLTATFVISAPIGGVLTERFGPRPPLLLGMALTFVAFLGLTGLDVDTGYNGQWPFFFLIGMAFGLVIVSTTEAIVGNIPVDRGGIGGGLQSTANQLGGVLGTAIFGSIIVSTVSGALPDKLAAAHVPDDVAAQVAGQAEVVGQGVAPVSAQMSSAVAHAVTTASQDAFIQGLHVAMYVGAGLSVVGALLSLLVRRGRELADDEKAAL
jgi:MFS family permease